MHNKTDGSHGGLEGRLVHPCNISVQSLPMGPYPPKITYGCSLIPVLEVISLTFPMHGNGHYENVHFCIKFTQIDSGLILKLIYFYLRPWSLLI